MARRKQQQRAAHKVTLHELEGLSLVMLCSCQGIVRKLAVHLLKEIRNLFTILNIPKVSALLNLFLWQRRLLFVFTQNAVMEYVFSYWVLELVIT